MNRERALELSQTFETATEDAQRLQGETKSMALSVKALSPPNSGENTCFTLWCHHFSKLDSNSRF